MTFAFQLGREPLLALYELMSVFNKQEDEVIFLSENIVMIGITKEESLLFKRLGGSIKMAKLAATLLQDAFNSNAEDIVTEVIGDLPKENFSGSFALNFFGDAPKSILKRKKKVGITIKKNLKQTLSHVRFVESSEDITSSVTVKRNRLLRGADLWFVYKDDQVFMFHTVDVQDYQRFSERDFGRPKRDSRNGMLPPKLARIMLNLAHIDSHSVVYDPFVGSGTLLQEAIELGVHKVIGSDIDKEQIDFTKENLEWFAKDSKDNKPATLFVRDIAQVKIKEVIETTHMVAELDLGEPLTNNTSVQEAKERASDATVLVKSALTLAASLPKLQSCVLAIPFWVHYAHKHTYTPYTPPSGLRLVEIDSKIVQQNKNKISPSGAPLYMREDQFVGREILVLEKY